MVSFDAVFTAIGVRITKTGGEDGTFTCDSTAGMEAFIATYASPHLVGIDFDIEGGETESDIEDLVDAAAGAQSQYPDCSSRSRSPRWHPPATRF